MKQKFNNLDEIYAFHNINREEFEQSISNLSPDTQAYEILKLVVSAYNNNEKVDFSNWNQTKYEPWFDYAYSAGGFVYIAYVDWDAYTTVGSRLCYLNLNDLKEATSNDEFMKIYNQYLN
ncbi:hypothetical protein [Empedobacter falsenii]|uniref:Uncharacterized protein n=1 Tax=Empedobacter falsenii TaxID=343874 RepID=A0A3R8SNR3_9FLAO|nr:hypothetical protein [Empedobacter falsenii]RRT94197.1 hypothetical protein EGI89_02180 [Empedobacter falsenii]RRT94391.1 hypothetical protein EGI88_02185 [Empedobacter falsenii]